MRQFVIGQLGGDHLHLIWIALRGALWYEGFENDGRTRHDHYNKSRYYALNLHSVFYRGEGEQLVVTAGFLHDGAPLDDGLGGHGEPRHRRMAVL